MMNDREGAEFEQPLTLENELWDDVCASTGPIFHEYCGGRVFWIHGEEFRCIKCCAKVTLDEMKVPDGATADQK